MTGQVEVGRTLRSLLLEETNAMPVDTHQAAQGLRRRLAHTRRRRRVTLAVAASVAAAVVVTVAATAGGGWLGADKDADPAQNPTQNPAQVQAETVARDFLDAYGRSDADTALTYLTDDALVQAFDTPEQLRLEFAWQRAHGYKQTIRDCSKEGDSASRVSLPAPSTCTASGPMRSDSARTAATTGISPSVTERSTQLSWTPRSGPAGLGTRCGGRSRPG